MKRYLTLAAAALTLTSFAQNRWDHELGLRTPPPQSGMFGSFWNYQIFAKFSPRKALHDPGTGRYAFRVRTGPNSVNFSRSSSNDNFWVNSSSTVGVERINHPNRRFSGYWGAELGLGINGYMSNGSNYISYAPAAGLLYGVRYKASKRITIAAELAPMFSLWYHKSNGIWQPPTQQFSLNGQSIGISALYRI